MKTSLIVLILLIVMILLVGCGDGSSGISGDSAYGVSPYASGSDAPQKAKMTGTGHETVCY